MAELLLVVNYASRGLLDAVKYLRTTTEFAGLELLVVTNRDKYVLNDKTKVPLKVVRTNFDYKLPEQMKPYAQQIRGVVCRGDKNIQFLRKLLPLLPSNVLVANDDALKAATDKKLMREILLREAPSISPAFVEVDDASAGSVEKIENALNYPVIIKPAHLASSLLIKLAHNNIELTDAIKESLIKIKEIYKKEGRVDDAQLIAEEYLEGEFYSVDTYILRQRQLFFCPPVRYIPADQIGIDDFFLYKRFVPANLSAEDVAQANETCKKAIVAMGLTYSSAHVELIKTQKGWKIIELGPRIGRFRHPMYKLAYGIDHILNDVLIHLDKKPTINQELINYCAAYSLYPSQEGKLDEIAGLGELTQQPELRNLKIFAKVGQDLKFAKNGGHAAGEFIVVSPEKARFENICNAIDSSVQVITN